MPNFYEQVLIKLKAEREIEKSRIENWGDKSMTAYPRHVLRKVQLEDEIERLERLSMPSQKARAADTPISRSDSEFEQAEIVAPGRRFTHSEDYREVTLRGKSYTLTFQQAQMIQILHEAHEGGKPNVSIAHILESLEKKSAKWQDTFRSNTEAKKALVTTGNRRGTLRLNL